MDVNNGAMIPEYFGKTIKVPVVEPVVVTIWDGIELDDD